MRNVHVLPALLLCAIIAMDSSRASFYQVASPWTWSCNATSSICTKQEKEMVLPRAGMSLAVCKLTCSSSAMLWPKPTGPTTISKNVVSFLASNINFVKLSSPTDQTRDLLVEASGIFRNRIQGLVPASSRSIRPNKADQLINIEVAITSPTTVPALDTNEKYKLTISTSGTVTSAYIVADTFFGARHAMETLAQLMVWDEDAVSLIIVTGAEIEDGPVFAHRGLSIDSARSYIEIDTLKKILDAMSYNKLNVMHWHLTDTQSFPFVSTRQPLMALYGAYSADKVYQPDDIRQLVQYATVRGVQILPELDVPAHVGAGWQWGPKYNLGDLVLCFNKQPWDEYCYQPPCGQFNPLNENVYSILGDLFRDMNELFQSSMFHMGGDEVRMPCWNETAEIVQWLADNGHGTEHDDFLILWSHFQTKALAALDQAYGREQPVIYWTNSLTDSPDPLQYLDPKRYVIQVWSDFNDTSIKKLYEKNFRLIMSNADSWYLDCGFGAWVGPGQKANNWCSPYKGWQTVYNNNPETIITDFGLNYNPDLVLGGEAAMWTEQTDGASIQSKLWPRGAALAERLWTHPDTDAYAAEYRMVHHRQRLIKLGVQADGVQPEFCYQNEGECP